MRRARALCLVLLLGACEGLAAAHNVGTVFSSPVDADGAALYWNPAAMSLAPTSLVQIVGNASIPQAQYQRFGIDEAQTGRPFPRVSFVAGAPEPVLGLIIDRLWHKRLRLGLSVTVPSVSGAAWPETVNDRGQEILGPTRYHVTSAQIFHAHVQLGGSIEVHRTFVLGVALNVIVSHLDVWKHVDMGNQSALTNILACNSNPIGCENPTLSTPLHFLANGVAAGASVGVLWRPIPQLRFGASYISPVKVPLAFTITADTKALDDFARRFVPSFGSLATNGSGHGSVTVPQRFHFAVAADVHPRIELMAMFRWVNTSATEIISAIVTQKNSNLLPDVIEIPSIRNDEWMVSARIAGHIRERTRLALSIEYNSKSTPDAYTTPANLDFDSIALNLGAKVRVWKGLSLGATFSQAFVLPRTITRTAVANDSPDPYNYADSTGSYTANLERIGLDLSGAF